MANRTFKVVGRDPETKRQKKKTVYTSKADYLKYKDDIIRRWTTYMNFDIEIYELVDNEWVLIN